jgi:hypothetical protein
MSRRILILANKNWEVDPLVSVLRSYRASPSKFTFEPPPTVTVEHAGVAKQIAARLSLKLPNDTTAEVWCVQDLMDPAKSSSSSEEKARVLTSLAANGPQPSLVVAFGTAANPAPGSHNGCVAIGSSVFVHNPHEQNPNPDSKWQHDAIGELQDLSQQQINDPLFSQLERNFSAVEARLLSTPINPAAPPTLILSKTHVALCNVNITNHANYAWADPEALRAFSQAAPNLSVGSVETTHGVIRLVVPSQQFVFVSGIANRMGRFDMEVAPRLYAQNFVASHNAGVALSWMMPTLMA